MHELEDCLQRVQLLLELLQVKLERPDLHPIGDLEATQHHRSVERPLELLAREKGLSDLVQGLHKELVGGLAAELRNDLAL